MREGILIAVQPHTLDPFDGFLGGCAVIFATNFGCQHRVLQYCAVRQEGEFLEHHRHLCLPKGSKPCPVIGHDVLAIHFDLAGRWLDQSIEMAD